jgi:hypothetical protein
LADRREHRLFGPRLRHRRRPPLAGLEIGGSESRIKG